MNGMNNIRNVERKRKERTLILRNIPWKVLHERFRPYFSCTVSLYHDIWNELLSLICWVWDGLSWISFWVFTVPKIPFLEVSSQHFLPTQQTFYEKNTRKVDEFFEKDNIFREIIMSENKNIPAWKQHMSSRSGGNVRLAFCSSSYSPYQTKKNTHRKKTESDIFYKQFCIWK